MSKSKTPPKQRKRANEAFLRAGKENAWPKGKSGNPKGRPRKFVTDLGIEGYKLSQINDAIQILMRCKPEELAVIADSKDNTVLEINIAKAILQDMKRGQVYTLETILSRVFGKPKNEIQASVDITETVHIYLPQNETDDEPDAIKK